MYLSLWTPRSIYSLTAHHGSAILGRHSRPNTGLHTTAPACCAGGTRRDLQLRTQLCTAATVRDLSSADPGAALAGWAGVAAGCSPLPQASGASPSHGTTAEKRHSHKLRERRRAPARAATHRHSPRTARPSVVGRSWSTLAACLKLGAGCVVCAGFGAPPWASFRTRGDGPCLRAAFITLVGYPRV